MDYINIMSYIKKHMLNELKSIASAVKNYIADAARTLNLQISTDITFNSSNHKSYIALLSSTPKTDDFSSTSFSSHQRSFLGEMF